MAHRSGRIDRPAMTDKVVSLSRKGYLSADILTENYRISGEVPLKGAPLVDMLNDKLSSFIRVENIYISPVHDPTVFTAQYPIGNVRKDTIAAVILAREEDGIARHSIYQSKPDAPILFSLFTVTKGFEVRGGLKLPSPTDIDNMLLQSLDPFITVFRATAKLTARPEILFTGGAIVLNRNFTNIFCVERATTDK
jgi:hypothetical protein